MPGLDWTWEEFLDLLRELQEKLPANQILASYKDPTRWLIYLTHFGGKIFEQQQDGTFQCRLNSPETLDALNRLQELYHLLPRSEQHNTVCALRLCTRQDIASYQLQGSYLPPAPGARRPESRFSDGGRSALHPENRQQLPAGPGTDPGISLSGTSTGDRQSQIRHPHPEKRGDSVL
ncbi:MAG: hypothetical protein L6W00_26295 [Lentisphaeria bacterium]|nr:MAG: hypothetical protein L6W00_26295 [Lentisphaeria bacterium]